MGGVKRRSRREGILQGRNFREWPPVIITHDFLVVFSALAHTITVAVVQSKHSGPRAGKLSICALFFIYMTEF